MLMLCRMEDTSLWTGAGLALLAASMLGLSGCATPQIVRVNPDQEISLGADEALLAFQVDSALPLENVRLTGFAHREKIDAGRHLWIARVPAGRFSWKGLNVAAGPWEGRYLIKRSAFGRPDELDFVIRAGHLNYAGDLIVRQWDISSSRGKIITIRIRNHAARALREIEANHPMLLDRFPIHSSSHSGDRFLEFYIEERARLKHERSESRARGENDGGSLGEAAP